MVSFCCKAFRVCAAPCTVAPSTAAPLTVAPSTTGRVYCPLPAFVVRELDGIPRVSELYWFWTRRGTVETARKKWTEAPADLFKEANVKDGQAYRFRDTFTVALLKSGTPSERVSILLEHSSVRITERHCNP